MVTFNDVGEFLEELHLRPPNVEKVVRLTYAQKLIQGVMRQLTLVAGYLVSHADGPTTIVELRIYVGDVWSSPNGQYEEPDRTTKRRGEELMEQLRTGIAERNLDTASGIYGAPRKDGL
jgi:hypothetical protein